MPRPHTHALVKMMCCSQLAASRSLNLVLTLFRSKTSNKTLYRPSPSVTVASCRLIRGSDRYTSKVSDSPLNV